MIDNLISFSIRNKLFIGLWVLALVGWGTYSFKQIPLDAVPDITTNQVQVITQSPTLAAQEVEQFVTFPIEMAMKNLPDVVEIRSISRFGISVVTVVFEEDMDIYRARQLISEQLKNASNDIPTSFGTPQLGPITTGLGEVYQYILHTEEGYDSVYSDMELRTINDWIVKRQLAGTEGIIDASGWGGHLKQYEVAVNPEQLNSMNISIAEVFAALKNNNENTGGSYIEKRYNTYFIRGEGLVKSISDIKKIVVKTIEGTPVLIRDIAKVGYGSAPRYGAITWNGKGEVVGGQVLMLKGENSYQVVETVKQRIEEIKKTLPKGVVLEPIIDRSKLISNAISTVTTNLLEGGLIVILILVLMLGNFRGGLIVASVIPLAMLFAMGMMNLFGVSANLMSLGAIDFGLVVDGSVIIVEAILFRLTTKFSGQQLTQGQMDAEVNTASSRIRTSAAFGEIIILIVYLPILALVGIEGKMFSPMAQTVSFAILGALILSMTYVPMMSALFLDNTISNKITLSDRIIAKLQTWYNPAIRFALRQRVMLVIASLLLFVTSLFTFSRLGGEFIPTLEEGDFALHQILPPGSSLQQSIEVSEKIHKVLLDSFPEIETLVSKIGTSEIATDPMPIEVGDIMVRMAPKDQWRYENNQAMFAQMKKVLEQIPGVHYEFSQPIQMRFNELISGVREDIAIKIFGEDTELLFAKAKEVKTIIESIDGVGDLRVEQTQGLPQMMVSYERNKLAQYGLNIHELNNTLRAAFAGETAGVVFEGERRFDLVVRLDEEYRQDIDNIRNLYVPLPNGEQIPLKEVAKIEFKAGPMQISRDDAKRRIVIGVNARNRDTESLVEEIQETLEQELNLPAGYYINYGGQFENLVAAKERLSVAVPVALLLIFVLLFFTFKSIKQALLIFSAIPLSAIGGVYALWLRDMPFSISAGVGFIALFGVAVLNGIVLVAYFNQLKEDGVSDINERILLGTQVRLRPVIMTAMVAALGFLPMALSSSVGAEVQRPLATVVIGGLFSATLLTLLVLPALYSLFDGMSFSFKNNKILGLIGLIIVFQLCTNKLTAQSDSSNLGELSIEKAVQLAKAYHPSMQIAKLQVEQQKKLKKTAFDLDKTQVSYTNGQLNSSIIDYQWQVSQSFKFPTRYISQFKLQNEKMDLSERAVAVADVKLEQKVRHAWWDLAYTNEQLVLLNELENTYNKFATAAAHRYTAGDINVLEKMSMKGQYQQVQLQKQQAQADVLIAQQELVQQIGIDSVFVLPVGSFVKTSISNIDSNTIDNNPIVNYYDQTQAIAKQEHKLSKQGFLPDLKVGYINQQIEGVEELSALQFGVGIPLFFWTQTGRVQAAKIGRDISQQEYRNQVLRLTNLYAIQQQEVNKLGQELVWYETEGLKTSTELLRFANKGYQAGEINYVEYISTSNRAVLLKLNYLKALKEYNQAVVDLHYLGGSYN